MKVENDVDVLSVDSPICMNNEEDYLQSPSSGKSGKSSESEVSHVFSCYCCVCVCILYIHAFLQLYIHMYSNMFVFVCLQC
jgi:hypothetical protein